MLPSASPFPRRLFAVAFISFALVGGLILAPSICSSGQGPEPDSLAYASVSVDTAALGAALYKPTGERLRDMMTVGMKRKFSVTGDPTRPSLVVRITSIVVPPDAAHDGLAGQMAPQTTDRMDGETLVVAPDGKVLRRFPITVSAPSTAPQGEDGIEADFRRLGDLVSSYASWSARFAGLR